MSEEKTLKRTKPCKRSHPLDRSSRSRNQWHCLDCRKVTYKLAGRKDNPPSSNKRVTPCLRGHPLSESKWISGQWQCIPCKTIHLRKSKYGLSHEDYLSRVQDCQGRCSCCGEIPNDHYGLIVEHNHLTDKIRGLTCQPCNMTIGLSKESVARLQACINYLEKHNE